MIYWHEITKYGMAIRSIHWNIGIHLHDNTLYLLGYIGMIGPYLHDNTLYILGYIGMGMFGPYLHDNTLDQLLAYNTWYIMAYEYLGHIENTWYTCVGMGIFSMY